MKDFYYILGLNRNSSPDEIKGAYRKLSKKLHPDLNQGDAYFENRFKDINEAFETLRDPATRARYDERLNRFDTEAETKKQQAYERAYEQTTRRPAAKAYRATSTKSMHRNRAIGLDITIVAVVLILAVYLYNTFVTSPKPRIVEQEAAPIAAVVHRPKHKPPHNFKSRPASDQDRAAKDRAANSKELSPEAIAVSPAFESSSAEASIRPATKPDTATKRGHKYDFLYSTYIHPNVTGIVPMRAYNTYSSNIIASIPAHTKVLVLERGNTYYRVFYDKNIGFVPKWSLEEK